MLKKIILLGLLIVAPMFCVTAPIVHAPASGTYNVSSADGTVLTYGAGETVNLPSTLANGTVIRVVNTDGSNDTTVTAVSCQMDGISNGSTVVAHTTDGATPTSKTFQWDGTSWWVIGRSTTT